MTIAELLRAALEQTGYLAVLTGLPDGARRRGNVEKLLDKAETSGRVTLSAFMQYLTDLSENEAREGEALLESEGAVQLMTVHKSKGLEFPLVVLVDTAYDWERSQSRRSPMVYGTGCKVYDADNEIQKPFAYRRAERLDKLRQIAERRRLLYVAATRAQDYLLVSGQIAYKPDQDIAAKGWLGWLIDALDLRDYTPQEALTIRYDWGEVRVFCPQTVSDPHAAAETYDDWGDLSGDLPPLLAAVPRAVDAPARSLTATQIADLGSAWLANPSESRDFFVQRWRRSVLHDAPAHVELARRVASKKVGEIVHRAIQWNIPDDDDELRDLLRRYAWEEGIVSAQASREAVDRAYVLLQRVRRSDVFRWIASAREVYRELPFVYRTDKRTIHGVIDVLLRGADDQWRLVDYKTSWVGKSVTPPMLADHALRYHLQVGVYAAAVQELVGIAPLVYIHYIRYAQTITVDENAWSGALAQLENYIGEIVKHDYD